MNASHILCLNLPLFMVMAFLLIVLVVGMHFREEALTLREYAVGQKNFTVSMLVAMVLSSTYGGGGLMCNIEQCYTKGIYWILIMAPCMLDLWVLRLLAIRMGPFMRHLSMAETMGVVYGRYTRLMTVFASIVCALIVIAGQMRAIFTTLLLCFKQIEPSLLVIGASLCLISYFTFGGIRSIALTDLFQLLTFAIVIPFLAHFMFLNTNRSMIRMLSLLDTHENLDLSKLTQDANFNPVGMLSLILGALVAYIRPEVVQRIYMASSPLQAKSVFNYATIFSIFFRCMIIFIPLAIAVAVPNALEQKDIWSYILDHIPSDFKGIVAISILGMAMATTDAMLNSTSVMICYDIPESIHRKGVSDTTQIQWAKGAIWLMILIAICLACYGADLFELFELSLEVYIPIVTAPFILAVFGLRSSDKTALIGMVTGILTIITWKIWIAPTLAIHGAFPCMLANGVAMLAAHYLLPQPTGAGWVKMEDPKKFERAATLIIEGKEYPTVEDNDDNEWDI